MGSNWTAVARWAAPAKRFAIDRRRDFTA